jgi:hypothetical protein
MPPIVAAFAKYCTMSFGYRFITLTTCLFRWTRIQGYVPTNNKYCYSELNVNSIDESQTNKQHVTSNFMIHPVIPNSKYELRLSSDLNLDKYAHVYLGGPGFKAMSPLIISTVIIL